MTLKVRLQGRSSFSNKNKKKENEEHQDGEICLTEAPPRADNRREVDDLAGIASGESQTSTVADHSTARTVLDGYISSRNNSTSGGSS